MASIEYIQYDECYNALVSRYGLQPKLQEISHVVNIAPEVTAYILIDGSMGEGGGQIIRLSIVMAIILGIPIHIINIRSNRPNPGLQNSNLTVLNALLSIAGGILSTSDTEQIEPIVGSTSIYYLPPIEPKQLKPYYKFDIGSAGSTTIVYQAIILLIDYFLIMQSVLKQVDIELIGGTEVPFSPPKLFFEKTLNNIYDKLGCKVISEVTKDGFYPIGKGIHKVSIYKPTDPIKNNFTDSTFITNIKLSVVYTDTELASKSAFKAKTILEKLSKGTVNLVKSNADGNAFMYIAQIIKDDMSEHITIYTDKNTTIESMAQNLMKQIHKISLSVAPISEHLADQIIPHLMLSGGGSFIVSSLNDYSLHLITLIDLFRMLMPSIIIDIEKVDIGYLINCLLYTSDAADE